MLQGAVQTLLDRQLDLTTLPATHGPTCLADGWSRHLVDREGKKVAVLEVEPKPSSPRQHAAQSPTPTCWRTPTGNIISVFKAETVVQRAVARVSDEIPVATVLTDRPFRRALLHRVRDGNHDLVILPSAGNWHLREQSRRWMRRYMPTRRPVPVLIVPGPQADRDERGAD